MRIEGEKMFHLKLTLYTIYADIYIFFVQFITRKMMLFDTFVNWVVDIFSSILFFASHSHVFFIIVARRCAESTIYANWMKRKALEETSIGWITTTSSGKAKCACYHEAEMLPSVKEKNSNFSRTWYWIVPIIFSRLFFLASFKQSIKSIHKVCDIHFTFIACIDIVIFAMICFNGFKTNLFSCFLWFVFLSKSKSFVGFALFSG